jgi:hypothetical protein
VYYKQSLNNPKLDYPQTKMISEHSHGNRKRERKLPGKGSDQNLKTNSRARKNLTNLSSSTTPQIPKGGNSGRDQQRWLTRDELLGPRVHGHRGQQERCWRWPAGRRPRARPAADPDPYVIPAAGHRRRQVARVAAQREHRAETLDPAAKTTARPNSRAGARGFGGERMDGDASVRGEWGIVGVSGGERDFLEEERRFLFIYPPIE